MIKKIIQLSQEYSLKDFYTIALAKGNHLESKKLENLLQIAPFIRKFSSVFVNYFSLKKIPPLEPLGKYENRLQEFLTELFDEITSNGLVKTVSWLLVQKIDVDTLFFPREPIEKNYSVITRGLNAMIDYLNCVGSIEGDPYDETLLYPLAILNPTIDEPFEKEAKELLERLTGFNARRDGESSPKYTDLKTRIEQVNGQIDSKLMSNNSYVSIVQQITEINKALKTVFKMTFNETFVSSDNKLAEFWEGLQAVGYVGGENCLNGNFFENRTKIEIWLRKDFPDLSEHLIKILENIQKKDELPKLAREPVPEAIQLYAINLLGTLGLKNEKAMTLMLKFHSRFLGKTIRDGAYSNLRKNESSVKAYFYKNLKNENDYKQKLLIAEKHDTIFSAIPAVSLIPAFGDSFKQVLEKLDHIIGDGGILLNDFIKSAYLKPESLQADTDETDKVNKQVQYFDQVNLSLEGFKNFVEQQQDDVFVKLLKLWGLNYVISWALADYLGERRLFQFIIQASGQNEFFSDASADQVVPLNDVIAYLAKEPDARQLIEKLMTFLLNSKISFDFRLFRSLFRIVAQRNIQLQGDVNIRDGFSEQRGYTSGDRIEEKERATVHFDDPYIFHPIVIFLITVLNMKNINIPKDAFIETDISLYLNSLAAIQTTPELGYQLFLANKLISSIPYIVDFASKHEGVIRKTIADLDESYFRKNVLIHYHRIKIHRSPSKLDLTYCLEVLDGLANKDLSTVLFNLKRLMQGIGDEAIPDMEKYFEIYNDKLQRLGKYLKLLKDKYSGTPWQEIADDSDYEITIKNLENIDDESLKDSLTLIKMANALSNYWTHRINDEFIQRAFNETEQSKYTQSSLVEQLSIIRGKRKEYQKRIRAYDPFLEPYQHIFIKRHVIQCDWNFDFFGFWPFYSESKFESYNVDKKLAILERSLLEKLEARLSTKLVRKDIVNDEVLETLREHIHCLILLMNHLIDEGLAPSKFFIDTLDILQEEQFSISQLNDILHILSYRELSHIDAFIANTFGHFPEKITKALGRENLDFGLETLSQSDDELLFPLVQETVLGNLIAEAHPIPLLERHLKNMMEIVENLTMISPSHRIFPEDQRTGEPFTPVHLGYKAYALTTLSQDGFNVPVLETIPVRFFQQNQNLLQRAYFSEYLATLIDRILLIEEKTEKLFYFRKNKLSSEQWKKIESFRQGYTFDTLNAPQLLLSVRSGSYRSMPGILGTVINVGLGDINKVALPSKDLRLALNTYRKFLSTFGSVVFGINDISFSKIISEYKKSLCLESKKKVKWEDLTNEQIQQLIQEFKHLIESENDALDEQKRVQLDWDDPLELLAYSTLGVWHSWDTDAAKKLRDFLDISNDWRTSVTLMEMKQADKNDRSFSAILFSGDPQGKINRPHGDLLFGRPGEEIASGLASEGTSLETIEKSDPKLYHQITDLLHQIKINKGNIDVDVEMVGEYNPQTDEMEIFILQERQMPVGNWAESEDYKLTPTEVEPIATGKGVNGGVQYGVLLDGVDCDYYQLKDVVRNVRKKLGGKDRFHGPGIFLLMLYVTPEEALKMNIPGVDGIVTSKIGKSSHASISAKRDGKLFVCEASVYKETQGWKINGQRIKLGDQENPDVFTIVANPKSVSPYSGNIYRGKMPLTENVRKR